MHASIPHDPSTPDTAAVAAAERRFSRIHAALRDCHEQHRQVAELSRTTDVERAVRAERLMLIHARRRAWLRLLDRAAVDAPHVHVVFIGAVGGAIEKEDSYVRFWRETAADWRARAERRPTSDVAGAMSNRHELEVAV